MKKLTSVLALVLAMMMLASCGGAQPAQEAKTENPEAEIRTTISGFMDAVFDVDTEKAKTYTSDESVVDEINSSLNIDDNLDKALSSFESTAGGMFPTDKLRTYLTSIFKKIFKTVTYDITNIEINGDTATASLTINVPDMDNLDMSSIDMESIMAQALGFDISDPQSVVTEFISRTGLSMEDLTAKYSTDQSALISDLFDAFSDEFEKMFEMAGDEGAKLAANAAKKEFNSTVTLEKGSDNTWKITKVD